MNIPLDKFEDWLRSKNLKERTIENYVYYYNKFTDPGFTQESVARFLSDRTNRNGVSRSFLANVQRFMRINYKELGISREQRLLISEVELPKLTGRTRVKRVKPLSQEEIMSIEKYLKTEQEKIQLLLSYHCGLRLGELLKVKMTDFYWKEWNKDKTNHCKCDVQGKGDKEGIALVPPSLMKRIYNYINNTPGDVSYLFKDTGRNWQRKLRQAGIDAGLTPLDEYNFPIKGTIVHPHRLRHSYANHLLNEKNFKLDEVQELLRHSSITSTQIYAQIDKSKLMDKLKNE